MRILPFSLCSLFLLAPAVAPEIEAQGGAPEPTDTEIVCYSAILTPYSSTITTYSTTELGAPLEGYYDAQVQANLYQGESMVGAGSTPIIEGQTIAEGELTATAAPTQFYLVSTHSVVPSPEMLDGETGDYYDFYGLAMMAGSCADVQNYCSVQAPPPPGYLGPEVAGPIGLGTTWDIVYASPPQITTIGTLGGSPLTLGSSGTLIVDGSALTAGGGDPDPEINVTSGTGLTLGTVSVESDSELQVGYTVDSNGSSAGAHGITVTTDAGTSAEYDVTVGDPTPVITSITTSAPNQTDFVAGTTTNFTISGQYFGTNPQVTISGTTCTGANYCGISNTSNNGATSTTTGWITLSASANGTAPVTVTSQGYNGGNGFVHWDNNSPTSNSENVIIDAAPAPPPPMIVLGQGAAACSGANIGGNPGPTQTVYVGQQIAFTGCLPSTVSPGDVTSMSWTPASPGGTAVGGYQTTTDTGAVLPLTSPSCAIGQNFCNFPGFYWVDQGNPRQFTFQYTVCCGGGSTSAVATFNVSGPSGASIGAVTDPVHNGVNIFLGSVGWSGWVIQLGRPLQESPGITFTASAALPGGNQGQYAWLQLLNTFNVHYRDATGRWACGLDQSPELDGVFNLELGPSAEDSPYSPLDDNPGEGEHEVWFQATQYLMWQPNPAPGCSGAACTILVPLATVGWQWTGDAINTLKTQQNGSTWTLTGCETCSNNPPSQGTASHPQWQRSTMTAPTGLACLQMQ